MGKEISFNEIDKFLSTVDPKGSMITVNTYSKITEHIDSGNYMLNAQLSGTLFGGYANARAYVLAGETSTGKSFLALNACRNAQKLGYNIIYMDSEAAMDIDTVEKFGIDTSRFRYQPVITIREARHVIAQLCENFKEHIVKKNTIPKVMIVLDSLTNLGSDKERQDALTNSDKRDMTKSQEIKALFRILTMDLSELKIPFLVTAHVYACVAGDTLVKLDNDLCKSIKNIVVGEFVKTQNGSNRVLATYKYDNVQSYNVLFTNGDSITCTDTHKFLVGTDPLDESNWKQLCDLSKYDYVVSNNNIGYSQIHNIKKDDLITVYDIEVEYVHHYICNNGIYMHNSIGSYIGGNEVAGGSGAKYMGSAIIELTKAQLKEKLEENGGEEKKTGIIVSSNIKKNRFAKPIKIQFHISFYRGMNKYVGLEPYISWANCGIERGKIINEKEFLKSYNNENKESQTVRNTEYIVIENDKENRYYFESKATSRYFAIKHLNTNIKPTDLFSPKIFTDEVLHTLDENVIKPTFCLPNINDNQDIQEFAEDLDLDEE